ncbi:class I adenylate-forming enzyme family protein [Nocardia jiangxiensis]|uniref:class I adenylate-forming enzyme family protein n=1 Tax=Nocardia jiangxiensis TaxID=282685 RepID=UPI000594CB02|nr:class I adenylate-forming enzyme family protein [Nocardia jiangxiensis]
MTVRSFWDGRVAASGADPFVSFGTTTWRYREFDEWVNELANGLSGAGVRAGDRVTLLLPNGIDLLRTELAAAKLGAVVIPIIPGSALADIAHVLQNSRPRFLISDKPSWEVITGDPDLVTELDACFVHGSGSPGSGARSHRELESGDRSAPALPPTRPMDPAAIMYTSGSTSKPKGVIQPQAGVATAGHAIAGRLSATSQDHWLCAMPLFHTAGTHMIVAAVIASGGRMTVMSRFDPVEFWRIARAGRTTVAMMVPTMLAMLAAQPPAPSDHDHDFRIFVTHVRPAGFQERFGVDMATVWAMTETSGLGTLTEAGYHGHAEQLVGWPYPDDARIQVVNSEGHALPPGTTGELCFAHPHAMLGYDNDPENTASTLVDGWVRSGDLARIDADGRVFFEGRLKNVIKRSGENIAAEEVEFALTAHPSIVDCVVSSVPDPIRIEEVHATVSVDSGSEITPERITEWAASRLARWKIPRYIQIAVEPLPRMANGKIDRTAVKAGIDTSSCWDARRT